MRCIATISLVAMLAMLVAGCAGGFSSLSGGSVPIGDIDGQVWRSPSRSLTAVGGLTVELLTPDGALARTTTTDADGRFAFRRVPHGRWCLRAHDVGDEALLGIDVQPKLPVVAALRLAPPHAALERLWITPSAEMITATVGDTVQFQAWDSADGGMGQDPLPVSWAVQGHIGAISPEGTLTVQREGAGLVVAQYGRARAQAAIRILPRGLPPVTPDQAPALPTADGQ